MRSKIIIPGSLFFSYLVIAGIERFCIEFIRTNEKYLFDIFSGAQIISVIMICIGSYFLLKPISHVDVEKNLFKFLPVKIFQNLKMNYHKF